MKKDYTFTARDGERIAVTAFGDISRAGGRCLIYVHGFKGFKDWGFVPYIGQYLADRGFFALTFNFSHNGIGDNPVEFTELDKFAANTLSREVQELSEIIDACRDGYFGDIENPQIGLLGHSRGGGISLLTSRLQSAIRAAAVWSAVSTFDRYSEDHKRKWRRDGYFEVVNQRTGQIMRLGVGFLNDVEKHRGDTLNIERAVKNLRCPLLIVHGEQDESVPAAEGIQIHQWAGSTGNELLLVPATGHTFGAKHPFEGSNDQLDMVLERTIAFFDRHL